MPFNRFNEDMNIIVKLSDEPNDTDGLSGEELKAEFDKSGLLIKAFLNNALIPALEAATAAENIGVAETVGLEDAPNVQAALEKILTAMRGISQGAVAPGSINTEKIANGAVTNPKLAVDAVKTANIENGAVAHSKLGADSVESVNIKPKSVIAEKLGDKSVKTTAIDDNAVKSEQLGDNCLMSRHFSPNCIPATSIPNSSLTADKFSQDLQIAVSNGGTGATNAADARKNLGVKNVQYGTSDLTPGVSDLETGVLYAVYE